VARDTLTALGSLGGRMLPPGGVYRTSTTSTKYWFVDGLGARRTASRAVAIELTGSGTVRAVSSSYLSPYPDVKRAMSIGLICGTQYYLAEGGVLRPISTTDAAQYPVAFTHVDASTCAAIPKFAAMGTLITKGGTYYQVADKHKKVISASAYKALVAGGALAAPSVDATFLGLIPTR
jgi:hypothetical protein